MNSKYKVFPESANSLNFSSVVLIITELLGVCMANLVVRQVWGGPDDKIICLQWGRSGFNPWVEKILWRQAGDPLPYPCLENVHEQRSLGGYNPWGHKETDMTERLSAQVFE